MKKHPPKSALKFLRWFCREDYLEEIEGNLFEVFESQFEVSPHRAKWAFFWQVLLHFRPDFIKSFAFDNPLIHKDMFKHNLLITYRGFLRNKTSFLINLIGLSTGLACVLLIYLWVNDELHIDKFHEKDNQLYQIMQNFHTPTDILTQEITPILLAEALAEELPEVKLAASTSSREENPTGIISSDDKDIVANGQFASDNYFDVFSYDLIKGDRQQVLLDKSNIVLSEGLAMKLFSSTDNIIGKTLKWKSRWFEKTVQVSGVFADVPANSTKQFDFLLNLDLLIAIDEYAGKWNGSYAETYVVLEEGASLDHFNSQIASFIQKKDSKIKDCTQFAQLYSQRYLYGQYENGIQVGGRISYIKLFSLIALFILLIACFNFMNLSTAQASKKMKEIGVKKAIGANRKALTIQFLTESVLMVVLSLIVAVLWVDLLLPQFNEVTGKSLHLSMDANLILTSLAIALITGLAVGSYPAFYLSGFNPVAVLKGIRKTSLSEQWVRKGLVVFQFTLSVIFIVAVLVVSEQLEYTQTKNLGFNRDNILTFERKDVGDTSDVLLTGLRNIPGVVNVANMAGSLLDGTNNQSGYSWRGEEVDKDFLFKSPIVSYNVIETLDMDLLAGRSFSKEHQDNRSKILINESALKMMQLDDPIGQRIGYGRTSEREIIGVVSDFNYGSIHHKVEPLIFRFGERGSTVMVKIKAGTEKRTIEQIGALFKKVSPAYPFEFAFMDEQYQTLYEAESRVAVISKYFSGLAILISCLGLFGLAAFTAERRAKEIGIRKVLGSNVWGIVRLLSNDFTKMVMIAIGIALPISYLVAKSWLEGFAYKIDLHWSFFAAAAVMTLFIAWFTVGMQAYKAAKVNPIQFLKSE